MDRATKIKLLKDLQAGKKSVKDLFPPYRVSLIEMQRGIWTEMDKFRNVKTEEIEIYIEALKQQHPEGVVVDRMGHEEYLEINERLENEY